jgi:hypothetical protein
MKLVLDIPDEIAESLAEHAINMARNEKDGEQYFIFPSGKQKARLREMFWRSLAAQCEAKNGS